MVVPNLGVRDEQTLAMEVDVGRGRCGAVSDAIERGIEGAARLDELLVDAKLFIGISELDLRCVAAAARGRR